MVAMPGADLSGAVGLPAAADVPSAAWGEVMALGVAQVTLCHLQPGWAAG